MKKIFNLERGFTFIELIVAFSIITILSSIGIASLVSYSRTQQLNSSVSELVELLNLAKSRSFSQVKPNIAICGNNTKLEGYEVRICGLSSSNCISGISTSGYELDVRCSGAVDYIRNYAKELPKSVTFDSGTTTTAVFFPIFSGGAYGAGQIVISSYGQTKTITINSSGVVTTK